MASYSYIAMSREMYKFFLYFILRLCSQEIGFEFLYGAELKKGKRSSVIGKHKVEIFFSLDFVSG